MKSFKQFVTEVKLKKNPCWSGYEPAEGNELKKKNGKFVPNCVPVKEDGAAAMGSAGPTNVVGGGAIAGSGGKGGEPGVHLPRRKKDPILMGMGKRKPPKA